MSFAENSSEDTELFIKALENLEIGNWTQEPLPNNPKPLSKRKSRSKKGITYGKVVQNPEVTARNRTGAVKPEAEEFEMDTGDDDNTTVYFVMADTC